MDFKYAIFDLDGTLLESMVQWRFCEVNQMEKFLGYKLDEATKQELKMMTYREMIEAVSKMSGKEYDFESNTEELHSEMKKLYVDGSVTLKPYAKEYLEHLKSKGVKICAATATPTDMCVPCLEKYDIYKYFDFIHTTAKTRSKKFPDIFYACLESFGEGADKSNTMVFEDACYSATTLYNNGFTFTALQDDSQTQSDLEFLKAHSYKFVDNLSQLMD